MFVLGCTVRKSIGLASFRSCFLAFLLFVLPCPLALAWGERGHRIVNTAAVNNLPEPLKSYFRARLSYLLEHASDPDYLVRENPQERPHHYTEVEAYDSYPFAAFRTQFVDQRRGPSARQLEHGDSVWQIEQFTLRLSEDLRRRRWNEADHDAVFAAHYACDLTQPLHTVMNYDGQLTRQAGIHARFETTLVNALADGWVLKPQPAVNEPDLRARIFREYVDSYNQRQLIFAADRIALDGHTYLDPQVLRTFIQIDGPVARKRLEAAAAFVSSLWYTAWVRAGKPALGN
jgi:S1/P1 Nuclease